jgi:circadian clock protein KaiB
MNRRVFFRFRLYTAVDTLNSALALANLTALCKLHLPNRYEIEVIDVFADPQRALTDQIRMTPTLLKIAPPPIQRIIGTLSQTERVLAALGLDSIPS